MKPNRIFIVLFNSPIPLNTSIKNHNSALLFIATSGDWARTSLGHYFTAIFNKQMSRQLTMSFAKLILVMICGSNSAKKKMTQSSWQNWLQVFYNSQV